MIHSQRPQMPVYCLVDYDPDGISIFRTYKYGSNSMGHEEHVTIANMQWLGLKSSDIISRSPLRLQTQPDSLDRSQSQDGIVVEDQDAQPEQGSVVVSGIRLPSASAEILVPLKDRDRQRAVGLLTKICDTESFGQEEMDQLREVQLMLILNIKAEIQAVDQMGDMAEWLEAKIGVV